MAISRSLKDGLITIEPDPIKTCDTDIAINTRIELKDIVEMERLQKIMDDFHELTQMGTSIIDMNGEVLIKSGWHSICALFHRQNPQTLKNCIESDTHPTGSLKEGETIEYKCKNHMRHVVTPIFVGGQHVGNVFLGQFFFDDEDPDTSTFVEQAEKYGFDKEEYLAALESVPRWSREKVEASVRFCVNLTTLISMLSLSKLNLLRENEERRKIEEAYRRTNEKLSLLNGITRHDINNQLVVLKGHLDLAMGSAPDPATVSRLVKIDRAVDNISAQISFTTDYQELGSASPRWQKVSELVADHVRALDIKGPSVSERCHDLELFADPMLSKVFYNLLEDSVKYGSRSVSMRLCCKDCDGDLIVVYEDDGMGIPNREREHLFQRGYGRGTGLGLFLSREILAITGMTIRECGEYGKGVRFEIRVPSGMYRFNNDRSP